MNIWTKPIYIKMRVWVPLVLLIVLGILVSSAVLYQNYVFHNLFFQTLSPDKIESVSVYSYYDKALTPLSTQEKEDVTALLANIRLKEAPYVDYRVTGDKGTDYHIKLKNGIHFDLNLSGGDPGVYIINGKAYSVGYRDDPNASEDFENIWRLEELYNTHREKYYPNDK